jgi:hypothetical protein
MESSLSVEVHHSAYGSDWSPAPSDIADELKRGSRLPPGFAVHRIERSARVLRVGVLELATARVALEYVDIPWSIPGRAAMVEALRPAFVGACAAAVNALNSIPLGVDTIDAGVPLGAGQNVGYHGAVDDRERRALHQEILDLRIEIDRLRCERGDHEGCIKGLREVIDAALGFVSALNLQDHVVDEQRQQRMLTQRLMAAIKGASASLL